MLQGPKAKHSNGAATNGITASTTAAVDSAEQSAALAQLVSDPAYAASGELRDLVTHFFQSSEKGAIDWANFERI